MLSTQKYKAAPKYDVVFYYPQHFNRSKDGSNPFFAPFIHLCKTHKLKYLLVEEPDTNTTYPKNPIACSFKFWLYLIHILRKVLPLILFESFHSRDYFIGGVLAQLTKNRFSSKVYITISNSMSNVLAGINPDSKVYDLQHGINYSWHWGYFDKEGKLNSYLESKQIRFLVYGTGFRDVFFKNHLNSTFLDSNKVITIGNLQQIKAETIPKELNKIVFALQIVKDEDIKDAYREKAKLVKFLNQIKNVCMSNGITLLLRHHPRFNNAISMDDLLNDFKFISFTDKSIEELMGEVFLQVTYNSTSIFNFALGGIPTYIASNELGEKVFIDEYKYPLITKDINQVINTYLLDRDKFLEDSEKVKLWAKQYYEPFNEFEALKVLKREED